MAIPERPLSVHPEFARRMRIGFVVCAFLGLLLGIGGLLCWRSGPRAPARRRRLAGWLDRRTDVLRQAGIEGRSTMSKKDLRKALREADA